MSRFAFRECYLPESRSLAGRTALDDVPLHVECPLVQGYAHNIADVYRVVQRMWNGSIVVDLLRPPGGEVKIVVWGSPAGDLLIGNLGCIDSRFRMVK